MAMKKFLTILMILVFPLGVIYCLGKNLFNRDFVAFLGGVFLFLGGFALSLWLFNPEIVIKFLPFLA